MMNRWHELYNNRSRVMKVVFALKRTRTIVAFILVFLCLVKAILWSKAPFHLHEGNVWSLLGMALVFLGTMFRAIALGTIRKHRLLATTGIYSLCRHPLYLGSMLVTAGFCMLLGDIGNVIVAMTYFAVFYSLTIAWEETRLAERYSDEHSRYAETTPLLLPFGSYRKSGFRWKHAVANGALKLILAVVLLLCVVEVMAEIMNS